MNAVTSAMRTVVLVGARPGTTAMELFGDLRAGDEALLVVLGLEPTQQQRRLTDEALTMAAERRFVLTAELVPNRSRLLERLREGDELRVFARPRECRRWTSEPGLNVSDAR